MSTGSGSGNSTRVEGGSSKSSSNWAVSSRACSSTLSRTVSSESGSPFKFAPPGPLACAPGPSRFKLVPARTLPLALLPVLLFHSRRSAPSSLNRRWSSMRGDDKTCIEGARTCLYMRDRKALVAEEMGVARGRRNRSPSVNTTSPSLWIEIAISAATCVAILVTLSLANPMRGALVAALEGSSSWSRRAALSAGSRVPRAEARGSALR
mmetsp:Transcript_47862/g.113001  ORF Transcript_47862/g.113001 Transcript_47862/m.113001 type:complete len:209 (-) Transcript_47862:2554-3180(-)